MTQYQNYKNRYNFDNVSNSNSTKQSNVINRRIRPIGNLDQKSVEKKIIKHSVISYRKLSQNKPNGQIAKFKSRVQKDNSISSIPNIEVQKQTKNLQRDSSQNSRCLKMHSLSVNVIRNNNSLQESPRKKPIKLQKTSQIQQQVTINKNKNYSQLKSTSGSASNKEKIPTFLRTKIQQKNQNKVQANFIEVGEKPILSRQDFQFGMKIGQGSYGKVFIAREVHINFLCVVKQISKAKINQLKIVQNIKRQLKLQSFMKHKNCAQIYGFFDDINYLYIVLQYLPDGDLQKNYVSKQNSLHQQVVAEILLQVCEVVKTMHKYDIIHRDIKPENIFLFGKTIKIGDFGCSVYSGTMRKTVIGTIEYMSPQELRQEKYNKQVDNWSIGILTYELIFGFSPYKDQIIRMLCNGQQKRQFPKVEFPTFPVISDNAKDFIRRLLTKQSQKRMNMQQALRHEFLQKAVQNRVKVQNTMKKLSDYLGF